MESRQDDTKTNTGTVYPPWYDSRVCSTSTVQRISRRQWNIPVWIYLHTTRTALIIQHFRGPVSHIVEVFYAHTWWDPRLFQGSFVIGEDMFSIQYSLVLMYLHYEYILQWNRPFLLKKLNITILEAKMSKLRPFLARLNLSYKRGYLDSSGIKNKHILKGWSTSSH